MVGGGGSGGAAVVGSGGLSGGAPLGPPVPVMVGVVPVCAPRVRQTRLVDWLDDCFVALMKGAVKKKWSTHCLPLGRTRAALLLVGVCRLASCATTEATKLDDAMPLRAE